MTLRGVCVAVFLIVAGSLTVWANVAPTMDDQYVVTVQNVPVTFDLRAEDADIDPLDPASEQLRFVILEGPSNGILVGDLEDVHYEDPHFGIVELTYMPAAGYAGTDIVVASVVDQHGVAASGTTTIEIDVASQRAEGLLSGNWNTEVTFDVQTGEFTVFRTQLTEVYRIDHFTMKGIVDWKMQTVGGSKTFIFDALRFVTDVTLGEFDISSTLVFDPEATGPAANLFDYWRTTTNVALLGLNFAHTAYITLPQTSSFQTIYVQGGFSGVSVSSMLRIELDDDCNFFLARNDTFLAWRYCDISLRATLGMTGNGFERAVFTAAGIPVPSVGGLPQDVELDVSVTLELEKKSLSAQLGWSPDWFGCIRLMAELVTVADSFAGGSVISERVTELNIYGIKIECEIPPGVNFVSATSLHKDYNSRMTGLTDYFEVIRLAGDLVGCCGVPGYWGISTYFCASSTFLMDWGMTIASFDIGMSEQFSFSFDLVMRSGELGDPTSEITVGWIARW
ncbi:MAG: Ig-like domain-containing protein [Candidatus Bipolaricaulia bacterium]